MLPASGVTNMPFGSATLRLSADNSKAILNFSFSGLSSTVTGEHIDNDPYLSSPSLILYDISATAPQPDGSYLWNIKSVGGLAPSDVIAILNRGQGLHHHPQRAIIPTANSSATSSPRQARPHSRRRPRRQPGPTTTPTPARRRASSSRRPSAPARATSPPCSRSATRTGSTTSSPCPPSHHLPLIAGQPELRPDAPLPGQHGL